MSRDLKPIHVKNFINRIYLVLRVCVQMCDVMFLTKFFSSKHGAMGRKLTVFFPGFASPLTGHRIENLLIQKHSQILLVIQLGRYARAQTSVNAKLSPCL